jgi:hypothetical protein
LTSAAQANSLVKVFDYKLVKAGYSTPAKVSIGLAYGRVLMIKAGHNGGGTAHVVYIGDVVTVTPPPSWRHKVATATSCHR